MPAVHKNGSVVLKKGVFKTDRLFWDWYNKIRMNTIERQTVIIKLCDGEGNPTLPWILNHAFPVKITSFDLKSDADELTLDSIGFYHQGLAITNG